MSIKIVTHRQKGFTLIELLVVIAVIGTLSSVVLGSVNTARTKSRDAERIATIKQVANVLEMYYTDNGHYPMVEWSDWDVGYGWEQMMRELATTTTPSGNPYLNATFALTSMSERSFTLPRLIERAYATAGPAYRPCSIQDPLYLEDDPEFDTHSYGYAAYDNGQKYLLRATLSNPNHSALQTSIEIPVDAALYYVDIMSTTTPAVSCDRTLGQYCFSNQRE